MQKARRMLSNISVINVILAVVLVLFLSYAVSPMFSKTVRIRVPVSKKQTAVTSSTPKPEEVKTPSPADYVVIADQNLFHPERKIPADRKDAAAPLPKPEFVLYGTLLTDDLHIAYMEDRKSPQNSPSRGKKQIPVKLGESLSGFTLKEIDTDRVVMVKGEEKIDVYLNDAAMPKDRGITAPPATAAAGPASSRGPQHPPQPHASTVAPEPKDAAQRPNAATRQNPPVAGKENAINKFLDVFKAQRGLPAPTAPRQ